MGVSNKRAWGGYIGGCRTLLIIKTYTQDLSQQGAFAFTLLPTKTMIFDLCKRAQKQRISLLLSYPSQYQFILLSKIEKKVGVNLQSNKISLTLLGTFCLERYQGKEEEEERKKEKGGQLEMISSFYTAGSIHLERLRV